MTVPSARAAALGLDGSRRRRLRATRRFDFRDDVTAFRISATFSSRRRPWSTWRAGGYLAFDEWPRRAGADVPAGCGYDAAGDRALAFSDAAPCGPEMDLSMPFNVATLQGTLAATSERSSRRSCSERAGNVKAPNWAAYSRQAGLAATTGRTEPWFSRFGARDRSGPVSRRSVGTGAR